MSVQMSSIHNTCLTDRELLRGDSGVFDETSSSISGHIRGDITPEPPTEAGFLNGIAVDGIFTSTPGVEGIPIRGRKLRGIELRKEELKAFMEVSLKDLLVLVLI